MKRCIGEVAEEAEQLTVCEVGQKLKRRRISRFVLESPKAKCEVSTHDFPFSLFLPVSTAATARPFSPTTQTNVNATPLNEFLYSTLQQELRIIYERLDAQVQQYLHENTSHRSKCFFIFELARRYKEENEQIYKQHIEEYLLKKLSNIQPRMCTPDAICKNALEERQDPKLQQANHLIMKSSQHNTTKESKDSLLQEAGELLLDLLPQPIGRVVDFFNNPDPSSFSPSPSIPSSPSSSLAEKKLMYVDVESHMDFEVIKLLHPDRDVRLLPVSHHHAFHLYVFLLIEQRQFNRASEVCSAALQRNPLFVHCMFEQAEIHKMEHNTQALLTLSLECLRICHKQRDIAKCYRNFGFYFVETQQYDYAVAAFMKSLTYEIHPMVNGELLFITKKLAETKDPMLGPVCTLLANVTTLEKRNRAFPCRTIPALKLDSGAEQHLHNMLAKAQIPCSPNLQLILPAYSVVSEHEKKMQPPSQNDELSCSVRADSVQIKQKFD